MERYDLPDGWEWLKLPEVADLIMGQSPPGSTYNKDGNGLPFYQGKADFGYPFPIPRVYCTKPKKVAQPGDILMSVRAPVGPTNLVNNECAIGRGLSIIRPKEGMPANYLRAYFTLIEQLIAELGTGSTFTSISRSDLENLDVPVSPIPERQRIVAKIESLFEQSRTARTALTRVPVLMSQFRRAVLTSATSGRLMEEWREMHPDAPKHRSVSLREVATEFRYGTSAKSQKTGEVPVLRMGNIQDRKLDWDDLVFTSDKSEIEKYKLVSGDVLFNRTNSPELVGKTAIYKGERPAIYAGYLIKVKCSDALLPDYLNYCINSPAGRDWASQVKSDGVSQSNINAQKLANFEFDLPPIEEQTEIVQRVEKMFAQADIINQAASASLRRAEQADQSILARSFRGELG